MDICLLPRPHSASFKKSKIIYDLDFKAVKKQILARGLTCSDFFLNANGQDI